MLANEIISLLSDENSSLSQVLLKTKVFLHEIGKKELAEWVNYELGGYPDEVPLPEYRTLDSRVLGDLIAPGWKACSQPLPIMHLEADYRAHIERTEVREAVQLVEELASREQGTLRRFFPPEAYNRLGSNVGNGWHVNAAWSEVSVLSIKNILVQVRSRLLEFMLELRDTVENNGGTEITKANTSVIDTASMFKKAIFGDNTTIIVGDNNRQNVDSEVHENDFDSLKRALTAIGVPDDELSKLKEAVDEDTAKVGRASFDGKTGRWYTSLVGKAASGALKIARGILTTVGAQALAAYMGLN